jgi:Mrp family chromosome partitioning ATPase
MGLSLLLAGSALSKEDCLSAVWATNIKGLSILTSGPTSMVSAHNLLYSSRTAELLHYYREEYDIVLIDSPPMLHMSDARVLAKFADAVILVLRLGRTTRDEALTAQKRFADDGHPVLGVVMNDWQPKDKSTYSTYKRYADAYAKPPLSTKPEPVDA